ncbi:hypothetical protein Taro_022667, partial [Colocasia esculenta]|nr:hypothetical protein [Colocasia esculenta]
LSGSAHRQSANTVFSFPPVSAVSSPPSPRPLYLPCPRRLSFAIPEEGGLGTVVAGEPRGFSVGTEVFLPGWGGEMGGASPPELQQEDSDAEFVEVDPSGRYGRYREVLGKGAFKTVYPCEISCSYRAFDEWEGIEVAWNQVKVADLLRSSDDLERLYAEVNLLKTLKHKNIIKFYNSWVDSREGNINFITEIFTSGTLRQYRKKHKHVEIRALKNWSRQILQGLHYLHSHDPPVIHRDLKCDNIFVNGNQGEVKIGDLGLAAILCHAQSAHSVIGTPEFMAPELYEEDYNELVDIYAFGMCLLELVTFEYPYMECANAAQIYKKVMAVRNALLGVVQLVKTLHKGSIPMRISSYLDVTGIKPASLEKVNDPEVRAFIEKCITKASERLPARDLLLDPFLQSDIEDESIGHSSRPDPNHSDDNDHQSGEASSSLNVNADSSGVSRDFTVQGQMKDTNTIFLKLRITDSTGHPHNIYFPFDIEADTSISVASEMVTELDLTDHDVSVIAAMIDAEIQSHVHGWIRSEIGQESHGNDQPALDNLNSQLKDEVSVPGTSHTCGDLVLERFPSGRLYWSDSPKETFEESSSRNCLSSISEGNHQGNAQNLGEADDAETSSLNPDEGSYSNGISSPSQSNGSAFSADGGTHNPSMADPSVSSELPSTPISSVVNGEDEESSSHQTNGCASLTNRSGDVYSADIAEPFGPSNSSPRGIPKEEDKESPFCADHQFADCQVRPVVNRHGDNCNKIHLPDDDKTSIESDPEDVKVLVVKLKNLLFDQRKELQELKKKHSLAIADLLNKLPPEIQDTAIDTHGLNTLGFKLHGQSSASARQPSDMDFISQGSSLPSHVDNPAVHNITGESSSAATMGTIAMPYMSCLEGSTSTLRGDGRKDHIPGDHVGGLISWNKSQMRNAELKSSDVGIALILRDHLSMTKSETDVTSPKPDED